MAMEAYCTLRTAILLSRAEKPPQTLLFTSAMHGEGKTVTTVNTAIVLAQMGARVLLIDADLRRSRCHELLGVQRRQGMTDILTGRGEPARAAPVYVYSRTVLSQQWLHATKPHRPCGLEKDARHAEHSLRTVRLYPD